MLREFLYVDLTRVRSLLAQLDDGLLESVVQSTSDSRKARVSAALFGAQVEGGIESGQSRQEQRSLQELVFTLFEQIGESTGLIADLDEADLSEPDRWESSKIHNEVDDGEIVRFCVPITIVDSVFLVNRMERFVAVSRAVAKFGGDDREAAVAEIDRLFEAGVAEQVAQLEGSRDQRKADERKLRRQAEQLRAEALAAVEAAVAESESGILAIQNIGEFLAAYLSSEAIDLRFMPCGPDESRYGFTGSLLGRDEYIQREREALLARFGSVLEGWTAVVQVAKVPTREASAAARSRSFDDLQLMDDEGVIDRTRILQTAVHMTEMLEAQGIAEGPQWPSISVIPLAIYRTVPRSLDLSSRPEASDPLPLE